MKIAPSLPIAALGFGLLFASPGLAQTSPTPAGPARTDAAPSVGAPVRGAGGEVLGRVESVTLGSDGRPVQVIVRSRGRADVRARSRALPVESFRPEGAGYIVPLRKAEFDLLPPRAR